MKWTFRLAVIALSGLLMAASNDNNVEWNGLAHIGADDFYRPDGDPSSPSDPTTIRIRTFHGDVTEVGVLVVQDGGDAKDFEWFAAVWSSEHSNATHDIWEVIFPGGANAFRYCPRITDGDDTDYLVFFMGTPYYVVWDDLPTPQQCWLIPAPPAPDASQPDTAQPDAARPDTSLPDTTVPDAFVGDTLQADTSRPDANRSDLAQPDGSAPDSTGVDAGSADASRPDTFVPDVTSADHTRVDGAGLDSALPDLRAPDAVITDASSATDNARVDSTSACTPGCQDESHRITCNLDGEAVVLTCSAGTVCRSGSCIDSSTEDPQVEDNGCGCTALDAHATWFPCALAVTLLWRRRRCVSK